MFGDYVFLFVITRESFEVSAFGERRNLHFDPSLTQRFNECHLRETARLRDGIRVQDGRPTKRKFARQRNRVQAIRVGRISRRLDIRLRTRWSGGDLVDERSVRTYGRNAKARRSVFLVPRRNCQIHHIVVHRNRRNYHVCSKLSIAFWK